MIIIMDIKQIILEQLEKNERIKVSEIVKTTGFSRGYINRFFQELRKEGKIVMIGKANKVFYVRAKRDSVQRAKKSITSIHKYLKNINLSEDIVLDSIKKETGIFIDLTQNVSRILDYTFTEILNNAIEHSQSEKIKIEMQRNQNNAKFTIVDHGIGIFQNIMQKKHLRNELEAIQDLLKGKQTTMPKEHSGEGIFFTSKVADTFLIESSEKQLLFNSLIDDVFVQDLKKKAVGTKASFNISLDSQRNLEHIFKEYAGETYEFSKTNVAVRLYKMGTLYISRSQARRIMSGLDKFKVIVLDFKHIKTVGQAFADQIFRVWKTHHPEIEIITQNTNDNINFMIKRAITLQKESPRQRALFRNGIN